MATVTSLDEVLTLLRARHLGDNDQALTPICTRVMLRTGINLRAPAPTQAQDTALIGKVLSCLSDLGYPL